MSSSALKKKNQTNEKHETTCDTRRRSHLVGGGGDGQLAGGFVESEPAPPGALHGNSLRGELLLEGGEGTKVPLNHGEQLALGRSAVPQSVSSLVRSTQARQLLEMWGVGTWGWGERELYNP